MTNMLAYQYDVTIVAIGTVLGSIGTISLTWFLSRKKTAAETDHEIASTTNTITEASERAVKMMSDQLTAAQKELERLKAQLKAALERIKHLEDIIERRQT